MFYDFKKSFLIFAVLKVLLNYNINLVNIPGVPLLTLELFCNISFALYFFIFKFSSLKRRNFPLLIGYISVIFSIVLSTVFSTVGFGTAVTRGVQMIINEFVFGYIFWTVLSTIKDLKLVIRGFIFIFLILVIYGIYEKFTGTNPIYDYTLSLNSGKNVIDWVYDDSRLGMGRVRSTIIHPIGLGVYLSGIMFLFLYTYFRRKLFWKIKIYQFIVLMLLGISVLFFTNTRSVLIFFAVLSLPFFDLRRKSSYKLIFVFAFIGLLSFSFFLPYFDNITSLFTKTGSTANVGGSDLNIRALQFASAFNIVKDNWLLGMGTKSIDNYLGHDSGILGAESVWLFLIIERGLVGIMTHMLLLYNVAKLAFISSSIYIFFLLVGWVVLTTITSIPGSDISFLFTVLFILTASTNLQKNISQNCKNDK